jgi:LuxR family maltose regulon positive regulatory protein
VNQQRDPPPLVVVRAKLRPPITPQHHVRRARLHELLDEGARSSLILVVAPAGAGKTALLSAWCAQSFVPTSWLSLDDGDQDGTQLWCDLIAATEALRPACGENAAVLLRARNTLAEVADQLLDELETIDDATSVLILDDTHLVRPGAGAEALALFVQHLPPWLHIALSGQEPNLPLDRLRDRGAPEHHELERPGSHVKGSNRRPQSSWDAP